MQNINILVEKMSTEEYVISHDDELTLATNVSEAVQFVLGTPSHVQVSLNAPSASAHNKYKYTL